MAELLGPWDPSNGGKISATIHCIQHQIPEFYEVVEGMRMSFNRVTTTTTEEEEEATVTVTYKRPKRNQ
eukprot:3214134-Amphidinium_carterae.4